MLKIPKLLWKKIWRNYETFNLIYYMVDWNVNWEMAWSRVARVFREGFAISHVRLPGGKWIDGGHVASKSAAFHGCAHGQQRNNFNWKVKRSMDTAFPELAILFDLWIDQPFRLPRCSKNVTLFVINDVKNDTDIMSSFFTIPW